MRGFVGGLHRRDLPARCHPSYAASESLAASGLSPYGSIEFLQASHVLVCPRCAGPMRLVAAVEQPVVIAANPRPPRPPHASPAAPTAVASATARRCHPRRRRPAQPLRVAAPPTAPVFATPSSASGEALRAPPSDVGALTDRQPGVDSTRLFGRCSTMTQWSGQQAIAQFETPVRHEAVPEPVEGGVHLVKS